MKVCAVVLLFACLVSSAAGQGTGTLRGSVHDVAGVPIPGASVRVTAAENGIVRQTETNDRGDYLFSDLAPGKYTLRAFVTGFKEVAITDITVEASRVSTAKVEMSFGSSIETVTLSASRVTVYNAVYEPTYPQTTDQLYDGQKTTVRFFIGDADKRSGLSPLNWAVNPKIAASEENIPLSVTMNCLPCGLDSVQTSLITYSGKKHASSEAVFKIVPQRARANAAGVGQLIFSVASHGVEIDHVVANVVVGERSKDVSISNSRREFEPDVPEEDVADLTIIIAGDQTGSVSVQLDARNAELLRIFNGRQLSGVKLKSFTTSVDVGGLNARASNAYIQLRRVVDQYDKPLQQALAGGPNGALNVPASAVLQFSEADYRQVLALLNELGTSLYRRLFVDDVDKNLRDMMVGFKKFNIPNRPVRLRVVAKNVHFPWELLHPPGNADPENFWGIRYVISVDSLNRNQEGRLPGALAMDKSSDQAFAAYMGNPGTQEEVSRLAIEQLDHFKQTFGGNVHLVRSSGDFVELLKDGGGSLKTIMAYTHGTSGIEVLSQPNGTVTVTTDVRGPRLLFADNNYVTPIQLDSLRNDLDEYHSSVLGESPLVFLNACETGVPGGTPLTGPTFPDTLLHLGARGVVATEAPVWALFAFHFGNALMDELGNGTVVPEALLRTRKQYLASRNPLGLLYSYYGAPDARIVMDSN